MKIFSLFSLLAFLILTSSAFAQFKVEGRLYSDSGCAYSYNTLGDFNVSYNSSFVKPVESVDFIIGFHNSWGDKDWASVRTVKASKNSDTLFVLSLAQIVVASRGRFVFDSIEWTVQVNYQDKTQAWYRPGNESSFFYAPLDIKMSCEKGEFGQMTVQSSHN